MTILGFLVLAIGGIFILVLLWLLAPVLSLVFEWFALLFRGLQLAPSWFRTAIWIFIGSFLMQLFVSFFIAGNVVCLQPNGQPYQLTSMPGGYLEAGVAKLLPIESFVDENTEGSIWGDMKNFIAELIPIPGMGSSEPSTTGSVDVMAGYGTLLTRGTDKDIYMPLRNPDMAGPNGVLLVPQSVTSVQQLVGLATNEEMRPSESATITVCAAELNGTLTGQCALSLNPCAYYGYKTVGDFVYDIEEGLPTQPVGSKVGYMVRVSGVSDGGLDYKFASFTKDLYGNYRLWYTRTLNNSCYPKSQCVYTVENPKYFIQLPNGDGGCIQGEYRTFDWNITLGGNWRGQNPREDFLKNLDDVNAPPEAPLPGITYLCDAKGDADARLFGLDISNVTFLYFIFSIVGVFALQRFLRNY